MGKKNKIKPEIVGKYKKKLKRHYESESDQEYIEKLRDNIYIEEEQKNDDEFNEFEDEKVIEPKVPKLVQSKSTSPKQSTLIAFEEQKEEPLEIAHHINHHDTSDISDTDISDNGSLNALSSSDEDELNANNELQKEEKRWI